MGIDPGGEGKSLQACRAGCLATMGRGAGRVHSKCSNAEQAGEGRAGRVGRIINKTNLGTMVDDRTSLEFSRQHLHHAGSG